MSIQSLVDGLNERNVTLEQLSGAVHSINEKKYLINITPHLTHLFKNNILFSDFILIEATDIETIPKWENVCAAVQYDVLQRATRADDHAFLSNMATKPEPVEGLKISLLHKKDAAQYNEEFETLKSLNTPVSMTVILQSSTSFRCVGVPS